MKKVLAITLLILIYIGPIGCSKNTVPFSPSVSNPTMKIPTYQAQWSGTKTTSFSNPTGVAVDKNGNVYVVDSDLNTVFKFNSAGQPLTQWGQSGNGPGQFDQPFDIALGNDGNVYVADTGNGRVQVMDTNGVFIKQIKSPGTQNTVSRPQGLAFDPNGVLYVSDISNTIWEFSGTNISEYGQSGSTTDQFIYPIGMSTDNNNLYVADHQSNKIVKFNYHSNSIVSWGTTGTGSGQFRNPSDVKLDHNGNLYVVDSSNSRVEILDGNGTYLTEFGNSGNADQILSFPSSIAIGNNGTVYVTDSGNGRVIEYALYTE